MNVRDKLTARQAMADGTAGISLVDPEAIITVHKPEQRAKAVGAFPFILGGGIMLGGIAFFAGVVLDAGQQLQSLGTGKMRAFPVPVQVTEKG